MKATGWGGLAARFPHRLGAWDGGLRAQLGFVVLVVVTGAGMGVIAVAFRALLNGANRLFFGSFKGLDLSSNLLERPYVALVPAAGGLLVGLYLRFVLRRASGHGVSEVIVAVETRGGRLSWLTGVHTAVGSTITIGSGGSAGPEGPIIQIGAALASGLGQLFRLSTARLRLLLACGAAAGLAGMYHAPLTGAAFAAEVLLEDLDPRRFSLLALASVLATAVAQQFQIEHVVSVATLPTAPWQDVPLDVVLGLMAAPLGVALFLVVHDLDHRLGRSRLPFWAGPVAGGLAVGLLGLVFPRILGSGETGIDQALNGQLSTGLLLALPFAKLAATSLTLGSGATGGVFTPSLFIGATLGAAFGGVVGHVWGGASPQASYALVGMGTVVAAVVNAPLTAVLLVCEFTHNFALLPEVVAAVAASVMLARALHPESIYTLPLRMQGIDRDLLRRSPLARIRVRDVLTRDWPTLTPERSLRQAIALGRTSGRSLFPVVDGDGRFRGLLDLAVVTEGVGIVGAEGTLQFPDRPVGELASRDVPLIDPEVTLHEVALTLAGMPSFLLAVPVVDRAGERYVGMLERAAILRGYSAAARLQERAQRQRHVPPPAGTPAG